MTHNIVQRKNRVFDSLSRMATELNAANTTIASYTYDGPGLRLPRAQGRISAMTVNGVSLVSSISYQPFGLPKSWMWNGGPLQSRLYDLDGRQISYPYTGTGTVTLTYDLGNRIKNLTGTVAKTYGYDKLDRLTSYSNEIYNYDADGNRSSHTVGATNYLYTNPATSNRLTSMAGPTARTFTYDASGNVTNISSGYAFTYDARGRMTNITTGSVNQCKRPAAPPVCG